MKEVFQPANILPQVEEFAAMITIYALDLFTFVGSTVTLLFLRF